MLMVCPMYGALPPQEQLKAFSPPPEGTRKVRYIQALSRLDESSHPVCGTRSSWPPT